jgi:Protein of unknown function (DUF3179)
MKLAGHVIVGSLVTIGFLLIVGGLLLAAEKEPDVDLDYVYSGGPPKDGIPSIDRPRFVTPQAAADFLQDGDKGIAFANGGKARFYPLMVLVWHEIVNDTVGGAPVAVTYCPLCESTAVFDPRVDGEPVNFGTSGKLWNSNLLMYDRRTDSLWSQILGKSITGSRAGRTLAVLPSTLTTFANWRAAHPEGEVLSPATGHKRAYGMDPYAGYAQVSSIYFPVAEHDDRLHYKQYVMGVVIDGQARAYLPEAVRRRGKVEDEFAGRKLVIEAGEAPSDIRVFEKTPTGKIVPLASMGAYWFCWVAAHPQTDLYR